LRPFCAQTLGCQNETFFSLLVLEVQKVLPTSHKQANSNKKKNDMHEIMERSETTTSNWRLMNLAWLGLGGFFCVNLSNCNKYPSYKKNSIKFPLLSSSSSRFPTFKVWKAFHLGATQVQMMQFLNIFLHLILRRTFAARTETHTKRRIMAGIRGWWNWKLMGQQFPPRNLL
jgi:hypothetical protein